MAESERPELPDTTFDEIPGTYVFHSGRARQGYALNKMAIALNDADEREQFKTNEDAFLAKWGLTEEQKDAVRRRDWIKMLQLGGNIYFTVKIGIVDGLSVQEINAQMTGVTTEEFKRMLAEGGRKHG